MRILTALLPLLFYSMTVAHADGIEGQVLSEEDETLVGATVEIDELERGTATDAEGRFRFDDVPAGDYSLTVRFLGYQPTEVRVRVPQEEDLVIRLSPTEAVIDDVIVTASPVGSTTYQPAQAFGVQELQERSASSFGELLDGEPGIAMRSFGPAPSRPVIRGFDGNRVLILENGERMGDLSNTAADHNISLDPLAAERVEVVRGPASLLYGSSAVGGVVNILTSDIPRDWRPGHSGTIAMEGASTNNSMSGLGRYQVGGESWAGTARFSARDADDVRTPGGVLPGTEISNFEGGAGFGYRANRFDGGLSISALNHTFGLPEELDDPDEEAEVRMNQQTLQGRATWQQDAFFEKIDLRLHGSRLFQQEVEMEHEPDGSIDEDIELEFDQLSANSTLTLHHRPFSVFDEGALGVNLHGRTMDVGGDEAFTPGVENGSVALFTFQEIPLSDQVRLQLGLRGEAQSLRTRQNADFPAIDEQRSNQALSGSIGLNVRPTSGLEIGAQVARAHRFPILEELFADGVHFGIGVFERGDPTLSTEVGLGTDLFARWSNGRVDAEIAGFFTRIDDFIAFVPTGEVFVDDSEREWDVFEYRAGDAELFGGETQLRVALTERLQMGASADFVRGTRVDTDEALPRMPPLRGRLSVRYDTDTWWLGASARVVNEQARVASEELQTNGYTLLGLNAGVRLDASGSHRISLRIDNVTNTEYRDHLSRIDRSEFGFPMPGRDMALSYRYMF